MRLFCASDLWLVGERRGLFDALSRTPCGREEAFLMLRPASHVGEKRAFEKSLFDDVSSENDRYE